jgi:hypothetical protein
MTLNRRDIHFHLAFVSKKNTGPASTIEILLLQMQNAENHSTFQSYWIRLHIKLMLFTTYFPINLSMNAISVSIILLQHRLLADQPF